MELFTYSYSVTTYLHCDISFVSGVHFGPFFRKQKGFYLQKSMEHKNFEAQHLKTAQNAEPYNSKVTICV